MKFKIIAGRYIDKSGTSYTKGQIVRSRKPLDKLIKNKFVRVTPSESPPKPAAKESTLQSAPRQPVNSTESQDITDVFPSAEELGVVVIEKNSWCTVKDKETGKPVTEKRLRRPQVANLLDEMEDGNQEEGGA